MATSRPRAWFVYLSMAAFVGLSPQPAAAQQAGPFFIDGNPANGSGVSPAPSPVTDPNGSTKELGPINSNTTKVGVINTAPTPMLGNTNPNGQVDLNTVYTQTAKDTTVGSPTFGHLWYYFAWTRDANSGSGFISVEFQQSDVSAACKTSYTSSTCNPWSGRQANDFLLLWDQSGGSTDILKRVFSGSGPNFTLGAAVDLGSAVAKFSADGFSGELAIDLTADVFPQDGTCVSFANIIPGTVTGNSDTADYKDAVLSAFPDVQNCGTVTIKKVTSPTGLSGNFTYTLNTTDGKAIFPTKNGVVQKDSDCTTNSALECVGTLTQDQEIDTIGGLLEDDTLYTLDEDPGTGFTKTSIVCTLGTTTWTRGAATGGFPFAVVAGQTTACVITNTIVKSTPDENTRQMGAATITDRINLSNIKDHTSNTGVKVTFKLFSSDTCSAASQVGSSQEVALTYDAAVNGVRTAHATTSAISINPTPSIYYWTVTYPGDDLNNGFTTTCGQESASVAFTFVGN